MRFACDFQPSVFQDGRQRRVPNGVVPGAVEDFQSAGRRCWTEQMKRNGPRPLRRPIAVRHATFEFGPLFPALTRSGTRDSRIHSHPKL